MSDRERERAMPPWHDSREGIGNSILFLVVTFIVMVVGVLLFFGMGMLFV